MAGRFDGLIVASAAAIFKQHCPGFYGKNAGQTDTEKRSRQAAWRHAAAAQAILLEDLLEASENLVYRKKKKSSKPLRFQGFFLELLGRFELPTSSLPMTRSTD